GGGDGGVGVRGAESGGVRGRRVAPPSSPAGGGRRAGAPVRQWPTEASVGASDPGRGRESGAGSGREKVEEEGKLGIGPPSPGARGSREDEVGGEEGADSGENPHGQQRRRGHEEQQRDGEAGRDPPDDRVIGGEGPSRRVDPPI